MNGQETAVKHIIGVLFKTIEIFVAIPIWRRVPTMAIFKNIPPSICITKIRYAKRFALFPGLPVYRFQGDR
ncbi:MULTISPECIES: hypothetical protein [Sphingobacterium]|uniref:hypothetical protein n=1 Tax=Sphingobacterium TaxID=28453 RepID=UPI0011131F5F|nr:MULTISPECIES: hypothetical protein [Sphingobacterium]